MSKVKYIRVSTIEQNTARQEVNAKEFSKIYIDKISGSIPFNERKEGQKLLMDIESGMITEIHTNSVDRLGRNIVELLGMIEYLNQKSINLFIENIGMYSLIDHQPNPSFKMIVSVLGNVAEMERAAILQRQKEGIEQAKKRGKYTGRLYGTKMTNDEILNKYKALVKELKNGQSLRRSARLGNASLGTAQKIQRILKLKYSPAQL